MNTELTETQVRRIEERLNAIQRCTRGDNRVFNYVRLIRLELRKAKRRSMHNKERNTQTSKIAKN